MTPRLGLLTVLCCSALLPAQTVFVREAPLGNDGNAGTAASPFLTITKAASVATPGSTIQVFPGTYGTLETVEFTTKNLVLNGSGTGPTGTIIKGNLTGTKNYPTGTPPGVLDIHRVGIVVSGPIRVDVRNLTIDMDFNYTNLPSGRLYGALFMNGADGSLDNVEVKNARTNPAGGPPSLGVVIRGDNAGDLCDVTIHKCHIHDWNKGGVVAAYNANLAMDESVIVGSGPLPAVATAQNAVQVSTGATCVLRNNLVKDTFFIPVANTATGILLFDHGAGCLLEGNNVNRCQSGILVFRSAAASIPVTLRSNKVTESAFGIEVSLDKGVTATDNVIHGATNETAFDDTAGNTWSGNNYSDWTGVGPYALLGGGGSIDATPRRGYDALGAATPIPVGGIPVDVVVADFGGSAALDFATVNEPTIAIASPSISVGIAGVFPAYTVKTTVFGAGGELPAAITFGQFDGAPGLDLAVVTSSGNRLFVFMNDGAGNFPASVAIGLPAAIQAPNDLAAADFNGDGKSDLVIASLGGFQSAGGGFVLLNTGTGAAYTVSALPGVFTAFCKSVAVGLLDANLTQDIALTEGTGSDGRVHLYSGNGSGVFTAFASSPVTLLSDPTSVAIGDIDADGKNDVAVTGTNAALPLVAGYAAFLINNLPTGFNTTIHRTANGPQSISFGDLNNDQDPDTNRRDAALVNFASKTVSVLASYQLGGFAGNFLALAGTTPRACVIAAMNPDVFADLVVADASNQTVLIVLGIPTPLGDLYGFGCPGTGGKIPLIAPAGSPASAKQPNLTFGVAVSNAKASAFAILVGATAPFAGPYAPCQFLLASTDVVWSQFTNAAGQSTVPVPIPATPNLVGGTVYFQWGILDPAGGFAASFALSEGLKVRVGL